MAGRSSRIRCDKTIMIRTARVLFLRSAIAKTLLLSAASCGNDKGQGDTTNTKTGYSCNELASGTGFGITNSATYSSGVGLDGFVNQGYGVTWLNAGNGSSGSAVINTNACYSFFPYFPLPTVIKVCPWWATIPLASGNNEITIDDYDQNGTQMGRICTTITGSTP